MLVFAHDMFFGDLQLSRSLKGITISHRVANFPPEEVRVHTHSDAHFVLVTSGAYVSSARGDDNRRTVIYNPPGTTHRDHFRQGLGSFFTVSISTERLAELTDDRLQPGATHLTHERARGLAVALLMECARWGSSSPLKAESLCVELLAAASERAAAAPKSPPRWLRDAAALILDCPLDARDVGEVADTVGVHPTHLARGFRSFLGSTPGDLLRARRLETAASLLLTSSRSLADVALSSGFADQSQFTKAFARTYGMPPGAFRRMRFRPSTPRSRNVAF